MDWNGELAQHRPTLIRYCSALTHMPSQAEDLAQETLLEAWRHHDRFQGGDSLLPWLFAIARNVCRRRQQATQREQMQPLTEDVVETHAVLDEEMSWALEQHEVAVLLDRALALLPPSLRDAVVASYVLELPRATIARRLGIQEGAVRVRVHRGKVALARVLHTTLADEAAALDLVTTRRDHWQSTRIWCASCGVQRLQGQLTPTEVRLRCPACYAKTGLDFLATTQQTLFAGLTSFVGILKRDMLQTGTLFRSALASGMLLCPACHAPNPLQRTPPAAIAEAFVGGRGMHSWCAECGQIFAQSLAGLCLYLPEGQHFWRRYPQLRTLPPLDIEYAGRPAIVMRFASITSAAQFAVITDATTLRVLQVQTPVIRSAEK